jgi:Na+-translocating ferredoxin:NAD+ oxidoreductase RnfD subunit
MSLQSSESLNNTNISFKAAFNRIDVRYIVLAILALYLVLGFTILGFNRTPAQILLTTILTASFEVSLTRVFKGKWVFPLSAIITSCSLSILLNYSQSYYVLIVPVFFAIGSKYIFTFNGRHAFNPAQVAVTLSLIFASSIISVAPAYQWYGIESMSVFIGMFGVFLLLPKINRHWLVISFLGFFTINTFIRAMIMKHHLPFETLFLGTLSSPPFFLFTFFMITDPQTSPKTKKGQIIAGFFLALIDLLLHLKQSYYTFFFAGAAVQSSILIYRHFRAGIFNPLEYFKEKFFISGYYKRFTSLIMMGLVGFSFYSQFLKAHIDANLVQLRFEKLSPDSTFINPSMPIGRTTLERSDPRVHHLAKWLLSVGDSVSAGDINGDGFMDFFFTFPLKDDDSRNSLYLGAGDFTFRRFDLPAHIIEKSRDVETYGFSSQALFVDYDNDGDKDLYLTYMFGKPVLLQNQLAQTGVFSLVDITKKVGLDSYTNSVVTNFFDFNNDGLLDMVIGNVWPKTLPDYPIDKPQQLNLMKLPQAEYEGDIRMFNFMHASWNMSNNGGTNEVYVQKSDHTFKKLDSKKLGLTATRWTLAIATADFNQDGWIDLYVANDFGKDDLYYNINGERFENIKGKIFGSIGQDTYKGMNATIADFDNNGTSDVYISNVHHAYQAEGSLLWMWFKNGDGKLEPKEQATHTGALNEERFGWGAAAGDLNLDGAIDLVQANGMVDDTIDRMKGLAADDNCPDYWYVNEKIARSSPAFHRYVHRWGDIRGFCIYGQESNRVYINNGKDSLINKFVDVADVVGIAENTNSRGVAMVDINNDGKLDMGISHMFKGPSIFKNTMKMKVGEKNWLGINLESLQATCNRDAIGSKVIIRYKEDGKSKFQMREKVVLNGFNAQSENRILFGLGNYSGPIELEVNWCLKEVRNYKISKLNQYKKLILK